ncbi:phosphate ABC transporter substrate-binding protein [Candidatus Bathyarchaeota archaeon RBG_16_57_9]|nr:MAG: phosphate ABC transporter substrate-binding protein [Candidatus Bathyarchaeota archaeon RBG_16_57_9]
MKNNVIIAGIVAVLVVAAGGYYWWTTQQNLELTGTIEIDGSSTVFPITQAVAEEFRNVHPSVRVNVGVSGTGGGFRRFTSGETDISDASRPISESERALAQQNDVEYVELRVALDGISVVVNKGNTWVDYLTVEELKMMWEPGSLVDSWDDIRPEWPAQPLRLYGPGTDSGTFDYFTAEIVGEEGASRADFTASEDDNILVQGVSGDQNSLGYFGYAYYAENTDKLKIVPIDSGNGPVTPSDPTINGGQYTPLSRPLFIYVSMGSLERPEVKTFVVFYMENALDLVSEVGYTPLPEDVYLDNLDLIN